MRMHYQGVPRELVRKHYEDLCRGRVALNVFSESVQRFFPNNPSNATNYVSYLVNKMAERPSVRIRKIFLELSDVVLAP